VASERDERQTGVVSHVTADISSATDETANGTRQVVLFQHLGHNLGGGDAAQGCGRSAFPDHRIATNLKSKNEW
jgi:hypothetical protein